MFDRSKVRAVKQKLDASLAVLGKELGLTITVTGSARFTTSTINFKVAVVAPGQADEVSQAETDFRKFAVRFGFRPDDLGKPFTLRGRTYTIVGLRPNAPKYKVIGRTVRGADYGFEVSTVQAAMRQESGAPSGKRDDSVIIEELRRVECGLSPENLAMDGNASNTHIRVEGARLRADRARLIKELGREPTLQELYGME